MNSADNACRSKISVFLFLSNLAADRTHRKVFTVTAIALGVWTFVSLLMLALQCDISKPWQTFGKACHGSVRRNERLFHGICSLTHLQAARWQAISALDIVTEFAAVVLAVYFVRDVQITVSKKLTVISSFAARLA